MTGKDGQEGRITEPAWESEADGLADCGMVEGSCNDIHATRPLQDPSRLIDDHGCPNAQLEPRAAQMPQTPQVLPLVAHSTLPRGPAKGLRSVRKASRELSWLVQECRLGLQAHVIFVRERSAE